MAFLPKPFPDEVIGSVIARGSFQSGVPLKPLIRFIYGPTRSTVSFLMGSDLRRLAQLTGTDAEELLERHTVFPYAVAFMSQRERDRLRSKTLHLTAGRDSVASLTKSVSHGVPRRRFCPMCASEEMKRYGETYWHRTHLLPGVLICPRHREPLAQTSTRIRQHAQTRTLDLPPIVVHATSEPEISQPKYSRVTMLSVRALEGKVQDCEVLMALYRAAARRKGYPLTAGTLASAQLASALSHFYTTRFLTDAGCHFPESTHNAWPALMVRECPGVPFAPVKHILLRTFLELCDPVEGVADRHRRPGPVARDYARLDIRVARCVRAFLTKRTGRRRRYTVKTLLTHAHAWAPFRHRRALFPKTVASLSVFKSSGLAERQVGRRPYWRKRLGLDEPKR